MVQKEHQASRERRETLDYQGFQALKDYVENEGAQDLQDFPDKRVKRESQ
jgi:hypothetical protein